MKAEVTKDEKTVEVTGETARQWAQIFIYCYAMAGTFAAGSNLDEFRRTSRSAEFVEHIRTSRPSLLTKKNNAFEELPDLAAPA